MVFYSPLPFHKMMRTFTYAAVLVLLLSVSIPASFGLTAQNAAAQKMQDDENIVGYENRTATIDVAGFGQIKMMLYEPDAPITTANFIKLADSGFYNGLAFHRIVDDFVIQGGDPNSADDNPYNDGNGGSSETIPLEISENLTHIDMAVGMARSSEPDSASSQFYICDGAQPHLDGDYAVFALVVEGMDVVRDIASVDIYPVYRPYLHAMNHPAQEVVMTSVVISDPVPIYDNQTGNAGSSRGASFSLEGSGSLCLVGGLIATAVVGLAILALRRDRTMI